MIRTRMRRPGSDAEHWWDSHQGRMLLEDIRLGVMPIGGQTRNASQFGVRALGGSDTATRATVAVIQGPSGYHGRDLAKAVCDWVSHCVVTTLMYGQAEYAVVAEGSSAAIRRRTPHGFPGSAGMDDLQSWVTCTLPSKLARQVSELRKTLGMVSDPLVAGKLFGYFDESERPKVPFEYDVFRHGEAYALASATAFLGWNARGTFHPEHGQNAYHFICRELRFHGFKAMMRNLALECLNECLDGAGKMSGSPMGVEVSGLPSEADVARAMADLAEGQTSFSDLLARFEM